ncbi:hypothetical protein Tco_1104615 [Tanacetum coccineum]
MSDVASKLSQENLTWSFRRAPRSGVEQDQLTDLTTYMEGVVLGVTPDRWYWTLDGSGEFSVASDKKVIDDKQYPVRGIDIPSILCTVMWLAYQNPSSQLFFNCLVRKIIFARFAVGGRVYLMEVHSSDDGFLGS